MKLGLGLYRQMLTPENFRFARQCGATHIVAHLVDYFATPEQLSTGSGGEVWGLSHKDTPLWSLEELRDLRAAIEAEGLTLAAIENLEPAFWYDILLDGPRRAEQIEGLKTLIRRMGAAGIPVLGYNFSIAGVWGRGDRLSGRGGAVAPGVTPASLAGQTPIPAGVVWNMIYDPEAAPGTVGEVTYEQLWARLTGFLRELVPVAEEAGVKLAAHPDDPPLPTLRGTARLVYQPHYYQKLLDIYPSRANALEFCIGSLAEMTEGDIYEVVDHYSRQQALGYVHLRNVRGKVPDYEEVFIDEGDVDMHRVLRILRDNGYDGVVIPDHTPQMTCPAPWHAGMAYTLGYIRAALDSLEREH